MNLIEEIINDLIDKETSVTTALLKTKVLAKRIDHIELSKWVDNELNGYHENEPLPIYRKNYQCQIKGSYINGNMKYTNQPIPVIEAENKYGLELRETSFRQGISSLEKLEKDSSEGKLSMDYPLEIVSLIESAWRSLGNHYLNVINVRKIISTAVISEIIGSIKAKLLDFMLELESSFGEVSEIKSLKNEGNKITEIMNQTIINNTGNGNIVNAGNDNTNELNYTVKKGNVDDLQAELKKLEVNQEDIKELIEIINIDNHNSSEHKFGDKTNNWLSKIYSNALKGIGKITIGVATNIIPKIIKQYLGY